LTTPEIPATPDGTTVISTIDPDLQDVFPAGFMDLYEVHSYRNASRILATAYKDEFLQIIDRLMEFRIKTDEIVKLGGNKTEIAKNMENLLRPLDWNETRIRGDLHIRKHITYKAAQEIKSGRNKGNVKIVNKTREELAVLRGFVDGHKIDFVKNRVAVDLEWNSKDQTFDRDLYAVRTFYECGIIAVGALITRSASLAPLFAEIQPRVDIKDFKSKFGASTTWMGKLKYRLDAGRAGGCPILALGIKPGLVSDFADWKVAHPIIRRADFDVNDAAVLEAPPDDEE
jgi:CRISPR-associated protein Csd2